MVDAGRQNDQVVLLQLNSDPVIALASNIEITGAVSDIPDLLIFVQVLVEEHLHLGLIHITHGLRGDGDLIAILVVAFPCDLVDGVDCGVAGVEHTERSKFVLWDRTMGIMGQTLVALHWVSETSPISYTDTHLAVVEPVCSHLDLIVCMLLTCDKLSWIESMRAIVYREPPVTVILQAGHV